MINFFRRKDHTLSDRLVWHAASMLLAYPDQEQNDRLRAVGEILDHLPADARAQLMPSVRYLAETDLYDAAANYVETFDLRRRATMYLTYWTSGDTRNRGREILAFADAYRAAGVDPPKDESADHLTVVLEFAALVDPVGGSALLATHRAALETIRASLERADSPYAQLFSAIRGTLPVMPEGKVRQVSADGPPVEAVGLEPFTLTVPPRRERTGAT